MNPERWKKIDQLLDSLLELEQDRRAEYLDRACGDDSALRREIESLLAAHSRSVGFIDTLRVGAAADFFGKSESEELVGRSISHYRVLSSLGAGGMGEVYLASDSRLGRSVALKLLAAVFTRDEERVKRFQQEASAASALNHPGILTVYEIGHQEDFHFIATEYVEGETLRQRILRGPIDVIAALEIAIQIAAALGAAHSAGIVHRDVKPENIMLRPDGLVKILDFGIAKLTQNPTLPETLASPSIASVHTEAGAILGTIQYMSPEQLRALAVDPRSDVFSLGIVLYEMVAGVRPFRGETPTDDMVAILEKEPAALKGPAELDRIVRKTLSKNRELRYKSAVELHGDLKILLRQMEMSVQGLLVCPTCARENATSLAFCTTCGAALRKACPKCNEQIPAVDGFCGMCGFRISVQKETNSFGQTGTLTSGLGGERRRATIVYSTFSGSSAILEQLDPIQADREISLIRTAVAEVVTRHGGTVDRCSEEELVALFGAPASYEDDFLRAVRAALDLLSVVRGFSAELGQRLGQPIKAFIGISTGPVVTRLREDNKYSVSGDALQLASRLAAHAHADQILVSSETHRLIQPFFNLQARAPVSLTPAAQPVTVYSVEGETGVHTRLQAAEIMGLTRYIGRTKEMAILQSALERTLAGEGQFVTVLGDAGVGKSRLVLEFLRTLDGRSINIIQSRCHARGSTTPYLPFIDLLADLIGVRRDKHDDEIRATAISRIKSIDPSLETYIPVFLHLLSIDDSATSDLKGNDLSLAIREAISAILTLHTKSAPGVLLLEDWHWADEASDETLKRVSGLLGVHPLMIVTTCRPERSIDWAYADNHTILNVGPLSESSSVRIVESIIGSEKLPEGLGGLLYRRTGGNPFFIEEVCRSLVDDATLQIVDGEVRLESSLENLNLPDSVQSLIRTRLDRLDAETQALIRHASILGREFSLRVLEQVVTDQSTLKLSLDSLQKQGLIQQLRVTPESVYRFKNALVQEVAYDSLLLHQRKALHEAAGLAIERIYTGRLEEQLEMLTFHFSRAENWSKAIQYGRESAEKASRLSRFAEALAMLEQAQTWSAKLEHKNERNQVLIDLLLAQERQCETLGMRERQQALIDRVFSLLPAEDQALRAETLVRQGELCTLLGCFNKAEAALDEALQIQRAQSDLIGERNVLRSTGFLHWRQGRYQDAVACNKTALEIDLRQDDSDGYAKDLTSLASILRSQGKAIEALKYVEEALKVNEITGRPFSQGYTLTVAANVFRDLGESDKSKEHYTRAIELTAQHGLYLHQIIIVSALAGLCWERCEVEESLRLSADLVALTRRLSLRGELAQALAVNSQRLVELDRFTEALPLLREASEIFSELNDDEELIRTLTSLAYLYERCGENNEAALAAWDKVESLRAREANASGELEALEGKARIARNQQRDLDGALGYLSRALRVAERIGDVEKQAELLNTMGIIEWGRLEYAKALENYQRALGIFETLGDIVHAGLMLNSIGVTLHKLGRSDEAAANLRQALQLHRQSGQRLLEGHALAALGDIFDESKSLDQAREYYSASLQIRQEINDRKGEGWMSHNLARILVSQGGAERARPLLNRAAQIAQETGDEQLGAACAQLQI